MSEIMKLSQSREADTIIRVADWKLDSLVGTQYAH
jgi:hypothetical protein